MVRAYVIGMTDYSSQTFSDMLIDIEHWIDGLKEVQECLLQGKEQLENEDYWKRVPSDISMLSIKLGKFFQTCELELKDILEELRINVKKHHIKRIKRIFLTAKELDSHLSKIWKSDLIERIENYDDENWILLEDVFYKEARQMTQDLFDLDNLADRLSDFIGKKVNNLNPRIYIDDIDSFEKVRSISSKSNISLLSNGYLDLPEDSIQTAFEEIVGESFHKKDWGGEGNDLFTTNILVKGKRTATAFLLKGKGLNKKTLEISGCGKNGDQILRLCESPADLFVIQFVGNISEAVIKDIDVKLRQLRVQGKDVFYCIINGQDTARLLSAYDKFAQATPPLEK